MSLEILEEINDIPEGLEIVDKINKDDLVIAKAISGKSKKFVKLADNKFKEIESLNKKTRFEPVIPFGEKIEMFRIMIFGKSGSGKTLLAGEFAKQYHKLTGGRIYYVCSTRIDDDRTFSQLKDIVKQIDVHEFYDKNMSKDDIRQMIKELFSDSLTIFDDNDMAKDAKLITEFRDLLCEVSRKYNGSLIFISHKNADGAKTKIIRNELSMYIAFKGNIKKNRLLTEYYGFDEDYLANIKTSSFACFNFVYDKVITPWMIKDFDVEVQKAVNPKRNLAKDKYKSIEEELKRLEELKQRNIRPDEKIELENIINSIKAKGH